MFFFYKKIGLGVINNFYFLSKFYVSPKNFFLIKFKDNIRFIVC